MSTLTEAQERVLAFMSEFQEQNNRPPSMREIRDGLGFASVNAVLKHMQALARKGLVTQTGDGRTWALKAREVQGHLFSVPVFGTVPAGLPADNVELSDETLRIDPAVFRLRSVRGLFGLNVRGDSMIDAQIASGDIAVLRPPPAEPGDIVAALIDGETTLKRLVRERGRMFLRAENRRYPDLLPTESLTIQGVLVGVIGRGER